MQLIKSSSLFLQKKTMTLCWCQWVFWFLLYDTKTINLINLFYHNILNTTPTTNMMQMWLGNTVALRLMELMSVILPNTAWLKSSNSIALNNHFDTKLHSWALPRWRWQQHALCKSGNQPGPEMWIFCLFPAKSDNEYLWIQMSWEQNTCFQSPWERFHSCDGNSMQGVN